MSLPPTSSSSALPSPSRRTAPASSRSMARVVLGPGQIQVVPEALLFNGLEVPLRWRGARRMGRVLIVPVGVWTVPSRGLRRDPGATRRVWAPPTLDYDSSGASGDFVGRVARREHDEAAQARDTLLRDRDASLELLEAQAEEVEQLQARLTREAAGSSTGAPGFVAPSAQEVEAMARGLHQANESESRRRWLLREVAAARLGLGAPAAPGWSVLGRVIHGGGAGGAGDGSEGGTGGGTPVELEAFVDGLQTPPLLEEIVQATRESLKAEFGPGGGQGESEEGQGGDD
ncbi:hypothetical protein C0992_009099 [Termitomyces sp. T32_za158]|nr:hypothetical protein C0992_009099 [Termitomyces sp. T32_za158]